MSTNCLIVSISIMCVMEIVIAMFKFLVLVLLSIVSPEDIVSVRYLEVTAF